MTRSTDALDRLATRCARRNLPPDAALFPAAERERLSPLLYHVFERCGWPDDVTARERALFRKAYYRNAGKNVELLGALSDVRTALAGRNVRCVTFKGADLATAVYPSVAVRPMGDVDIYVSPDDAERAESALSEIGYRPFSPDMIPGLSRQVRHARLYVGGPHQAVSIDLHWSLVGHAEDSRAPHREWIERATRDGGSARGLHLCDTAHLLYLAAHMKLQHYDETIPLLWLVDFHLLATEGAIDWSELFEDAARFAWTRALAACAADVRDRLDVELPDPLARIAQSPSTSLHRDGARQEPLRIWNELRTLSWRARLAMVRAYLFPSPSYVRFRYASRHSRLRWAWPLGYVYRWGTILFKGAALARQAVGRKAHPRPLLASRESC